jgi:hypothetical protein
VANRFVEAADKTVEKILRTPNAGAPKQLSNPSLARLRSWLVEEFEDIRVYYLTEKDEADHSGVARQEGHPAHSRAGGIMDNANNATAQINNDHTRKAYLNATNRVRTLAAL